MILTLSGLLGGVGLFLLALLVEPANTPTEPPAPTWERFSAYESGGCLPSGSSLGAWTVPELDDACIKVERDSARSWLHLEPSGRQSDGLALGPSVSEFELEADVLTVTSLAGAGGDRREVAWLVWNYVDSQHFSYFAPGPVGWELGRREPAGDVVLATAVQPSYPVGAWHRIKLSQNGGKLSVAVGGTRLAEIEASGSGKIGLYTFGAHAHFTNLYLRPLAP